MLILWNLEGVYCLLLVGDRLVMKCCRVLVVLLVWLRKGVWLLWVMVSVCVFGVSVVVVCIVVGDISWLCWLVIYRLGLFSVGSVLCRLVFFSRCRFFSRVCLVGVLCLISFWCSVCSFLWVCVEFIMFSVRKCFRVLLKLVFSLCLNCLNIVGFIVCG